MTRTKDRFGLSVCLGLALPYLFVMAFFAWWERRRHELVAWVISIAVFVAAFAVHAVLAHTQTVGSDAASQGWLRFSISCAGRHSWRSSRDG